MSDDNSAMKKNKEGQRTRGILHRVLFLDRVPGNTRSVLFKERTKVIMFGKE